MGITLAVAILIWILDYIICAISRKKFDGSKYGVYRTTIDLIVGLLSLILFGILIGVFIGAFIREIIYAKADRKRAIKASFGSLIDLLASTTLKFAVYFGYLILFLMKFW